MRTHNKYNCFPIGLSLGSGCTPLPHSIFYYSVAPKPFFCQLDAKALRSPVPFRRFSSVKDRHWGVCGPCWSLEYWVVNSSSHLTNAGQADKPCSSEFMKQVFPKLTRPGTSPRESGGGEDNASPGRPSFLSLLGPGISAWAPSVGILPRVGLGTGHAMLQMDPQCGPLSCVLSKTLPGARYRYETDKKQQPHLLPHPHAILDSLSPLVRKPCSTIAGNCTASGDNALFFPW